MQDRFNTTRAPRGTRFSLKAEAIAVAAPHSRTAIDYAGDSQRQASSWPLIVAIVLVAIALRPGIVSIGPILPMIRSKFGLSHGMAIAPTLLPFVWIPLAAFGLGGGFTLGMTLPLDNTHDADEANTWNAFVMTVGYLIAAAGPLLVGALRSWTGAFDIPFSLLVLVALVMFSLTPFLKPHRA